MTWLWIFFAGCGARSGLLFGDAGSDGPFDASPGEDAAPPCPACDDHLYCNGPEQCVGDTCATGPAPCDDGISCTVDSCLEEGDACAHEADDSLCPLSHGCDPRRGCVGHALAHDSVQLYEVWLPSGEVEPIGETGYGLLDVALDPNGDLWGVSWDAFVRVDEGTGRATYVGTTVTGLNALDAAEDGTLYAAGDALYRIDPSTGAATFVARYPDGRSSSGDLAFFEGRFLATATTFSESDDLIDIDLASGSAITIGSIGYPCVWGLAAFGSTLYGLTCDGTVLSIDPATGAATEVSHSTVGFYGATAR